MTPLNRHTHIETLEQSAFEMAALVKVIIPKMKCLPAAYLPDCCLLQNGNQLNTAHNTCQTYRIFPTNKILEDCKSIWPESYHRVGTSCPSCVSPSECFYLWACLTFRDTQISRCLFSLHWVYPMKAAMLCSICCLCHYNIVCLENTISLWSQPVRSDLTQQDSLCVC